MSKRVALALAALLAASIGAFAGAGPAAAVIGCDCGTALVEQPAPLSPDDASALVAAPAATGVSATTVVDPATVLAAATAPGADTSIEPDLTPAQAAGADPLPDAVPADGVSPDTTSTKILCWRNDAWGQWGIWPYEQRITDTTYWCAKYGVKITLRTTSVSAGGTLCGVGWRSDQLIGGGVGFEFTLVRSSAGFACPTDIPWFTLHTTHHVDVKRTDRGVSSVVGNG